MPIKFFGNYIIYFYNIIMEFNLKAWTEIKACPICNEYPEHHEATVIIKRKEYHRHCLNNIWCLLDKHLEDKHKYNIVDDIVTNNIAILKIISLFN